jgi:hypothetical protein
MKTPEANRSRTAACIHWYTEFRGIKPLQIARCSNSGSLRELGRNTTGSACQQVYIPPVKHDILNIPQNLVFKCVKGKNHTKILGWAQYHEI